MHLPKTRKIKTSTTPHLSWRRAAQVTAWVLFFILASNLGVPLAQDKQEATEEEDTPTGDVMRLVTILDTDEHGNILSSPTNITAENDAKEIYVINASRGNIIIYDRNFFPHLTLGAGRGIDRPSCIFFDIAQGLIYIGQGKGGGANKHSRLTILNAAFLPEKEIILSAIPGAEDFIPINGMLGKNGKIYLIGNESPGVLVLDRQGGFSHWLKPMDKTSRPAVKATDSSEKRLGYLANLQKETATPKEKEVGAPLGLPPELMPKSRGSIPKDKNKDKDLNPVTLNDIAIDSDGRIFLVSEEMSKVYAYGPGENFLFSFGNKGGSPGKMSRPRGLALDEKKKCIYIVDYMRQTILVFDMAGNFIFEFGGRGAAPMWFNFPNALDVDSQGRVIIADLFNHRVQILESDFAIDYPTFGKTKDTPTKKKGNSENETKQP